jgi:hypothetical protein
MMRKLEVGTVYKTKAGRLYLAVDVNLLIGVTKGKLVKTTPQVKFESLRTCSVENLLATWDVSVEFLDDITEKYLKPSEHRDTTKRPRRIPGTARGNFDNELDEFISLRLHRVIVT